MTTAKSQERHIICEVHAKTSQRQQVHELLLELVGPARAESGCLYYDLYQQADQPDTFYIIDGWTSAEAIAEHAEHPNVTRVVEQLTPLLEVPLKVTTSKRVSDPE
ncbi:putative quinol monooxygenase [Streptomyces sp. NPDC060209]|uniref:putative quinol monooxygenase n=1 Tax=Streptomyces sp. NPDC060209 TaxID=3347073 RepID=UPI003649D406